MPDLFPDTKKMVRPTAAMEYARAVLDRWGGSQSNAQNQGVSQ